MKKIGLLSISIFVIAVGCRKDAPLPPMDEVPVFYANALVDGDEKNYAAGVDGYYMYTDYNQSSGVPHYEGRLMNSTGADRSGWTVRFRGDNTGSATAVDSTLRVGQMNLQATVGRTEDQDEVLISVLPTFSNEIYSSFIWSFQFGAHTTDINPVFEWDTTRRTTQPYTTLTTVYASACEAHTTRVIDTRFPDEITYFMIESVTDTRYRVFIPNNEYMKLNEVNWKIRGNSVGKGQEKFININGVEDVQVEASFQHNSGAGTGMIRTLTLTPGGPDPCQVDFNYSVEPNFTEDIEQFHTLEVAYTTESGRVYSTTLHETPGVVEIEEINDYENDLDGRPTKKVRLTGSFLLKDASGDEMRIEDADFVIAVATKDP
ncbi:hypothetical protein [Phaeocystidibacter luteus]|uniref:Uncharacterized protein n=1 Tax=Phaeocystidibacter luteus TaxID=911197 RepID=A0A6N6RIF4_9FLAO|nr:hypothetical protein [Phaeocystidibacter luteus]KAB2810086.1 hypothetical protein F8C67_07570 [Phaeocystidibacter luteus]